MGETFKWFKCWLHFFARTRQVCACRLAKCKNLINLKTTKIQPQKIFDFWLGIFDFWLEIFGVSKPMFFGIGFQLATLNFGNLCETLTPFRWDSKSFAMFGIPDDWKQLCLWPGLWGKVLEGGDHIRHHWNLSVVWVSHWRQGVGIENHENYYCIRNNLHHLSIRLIQAAFSKKERFPQRCHQQINS